MSIGCVAPALTAGGVGVGEHLIGLLVFCLPVPGASHPMLLTPGETSLGFSFDLSPGSFLGTCTPSTLAVPLTNISMKEPAGAVGHSFLPQNLPGSGHTDALALTLLLSQGPWRRSQGPQLSSRCLSFITRQPGRVWGNTALKTQAWEPKKGHRPPPLGMSVTLVYRKFLDCRWKSILTPY